MIVCYPFSDAASKSVFTQMLERGVVAAENSSVLLRAFSLNPRDFLGSNPGCRRVTDAAWPSTLGAFG